MKLLLLSALLYFIVLISVIQNIWLLAIVSAILFVVRIRSWWLLPGAFLLDGYFGTFYTFPVVTACVILMVVIIELLRPRILWRRQSV